MSNAEKYIELYKKLENVVRVTYNIKQEESISYYLTNNARFKQSRDEILYCQQVRNLLQHKEKIKKEYPIEPHDEMIIFIENLIHRIEQRQKCFDICIKRDRIYSQTLEGSVKETISEMQKNMYTHVPIIENDYMIGVFDENSVFKYISEEEIISIDPELKFNDIERFLNIDDREMEEFLFINKRLYVDELQELFDEAFKRGKRVGAAFITERGSKNEKILGLITPWDIIGR